MDTLNMYLWFAGYIVNEITGSNPACRENDEGMYCRRVREFMIPVLAKMNLQIDERFIRSPSEMTAAPHPFTAGPP
jgi:hypothetical protein